MRLVRGVLQAGARLTAPAQPGKRAALLPGQRWFGEPEDMLHNVGISPVPLELWHVCRSRREAAVLGTALSCPCQTRDRVSRAATRPTCSRAGVLK